VGGEGVSQLRLTKEARKNKSLSQIAAPSAIGGFKNQRVWWWGKGTMATLLLEKKGGEENEIDTGTIVPGRGSPLSKMPRGFQSHSWASNQGS